MRAGGQVGGQGEVGRGGPPRIPFLQLLARNGRQSRQVHSEFTSGPHADRGLLKPSKIVGLFEERYTVRIRAEDYALG